MWSKALLSKIHVSQLSTWHTQYALIVQRYAQSTTADFLEHTAHHSQKVETPLHNKPKVIHKLESLEHGRRVIKIFPPPSRIKSQSVIISESERTRASICVDNPEKYIEYPDEYTRTVCDTLAAGINNSSFGECLGYRSPTTGKYKWISYAEVIERKTHIGSGLRSLGIAPSQTSKIGICTKTRPEFILTLYACAEYSMVLVPLHHCFGQTIISKIINQVDMEAIVCENIEIARGIIKNADNYPKLKHIILIEPPEDMSEFKDSQYKPITLNDLEVLGKSNIQKPNLPKPEDLFCIVYTSGTTGEPKGVMVTHRNVLSSFAAVNTMIGESFPIQGRIFCYLPSAHIYEIINEVFAIYNGAQLGFYSGNIETLLSDITELKPNVLPLVPKLMNLIYSGVKKKIGPNPLRRYFIRFSIDQNERKLKKGVVSKTGLYDKLILSKIQKVIGGDVQIIITSSAPVAKEVMRFFRCTMGCLVFEVYGLSEVGAATMTLISEHDSGFVGPPLPCNHIKLVDVPELSYFSKNDVGEICIRGANVFQGYYKNPASTKEAIDDEGWYHTGDIGKWLKNGALSIIDRKKHIFKMSQGEYIVPEKIEGIYIQSHIILQVFVDGDSNQDFAVAIVVPDQKPFLQWAKDEGFKVESFEKLCENKDLKIALLAHLLKTGKRKGLNSLHQVGNIHVTCETFNQDNNLLTPTLKLKRTEARNKFKDVFQNLYEEGNLRKIHQL